MHAPTTRRPLALMMITIVALVWGATTVAASDIPSTPDGTVTYLAHQIADGNPGVVWDAIPPTWQKDINAVTQEFAAKMDPVLWNKIFAVAQKAVAVAQDKKEVILGTSFMEQAGENKEEIAANWDSVAVAMSSLVNSELSDLENLKTMDWGKFSKGSGQQLVKQWMTLAEKQQTKEDAVNPVEALKSVAAEVLANDGQTAKLRITMDGEEPEEVELSKVEGRWVPKEMADEWDEKIAEAREEIANISEEEMQQQKMQIMMGMGMAEAMIDQVAMAETSEQLEQMLQGMLGGMMGGPGMAPDMEEPATE